mmetsp:Transcript_14185/g.29592  ORF Transcript_14185/g.29592 Transcript_14185/m.29592 type:complete len:237 (+) Transcript_14185:116-826(+)
MTSSIGPVVSCEKTVNGNPPYMTNTKKPKASSVAAAYPAISKRDMVRIPVKTFPKTQHPLAPILAKTCGVIMVEGMTNNATQTDNHWYPTMDRIGSSPAFTKSRVYCSRANGDKHIGNSAVEPKLSKSAPIMIFHMTALLIFSGRLGSVSDPRYALPPACCSATSLASPGSMRNLAINTEDTTISPDPTHNGEKSPDSFIRIAIIPPPAFPRTKFPTNIPSSFSFSIWSVLKTSPM